MKNLSITGSLLCLIPPHSSISIFISTAFKCWRNSKHLTTSTTHAWSKAKPSFIYYFNCFLTVESASFLVPLQSIFHISQNEPVNLQVGLFHLSLENLPVGSWLNQRKSVMVTARQHPLLTPGLDCFSDLISDTSAPSTHGSFLFCHIYWFIFPWACTYLRDFLLTLQVFFPPPSENSLIYYLLSSQWCFHDNHLQTTILHFLFLLYYSII